MLQPLQKIEFLAELGIIKPYFRLCPFLHTLLNQHLLNVTLNLQSDNNSTTHCV